MKILLVTNPPAANLGFLSSAFLSEPLALEYLGAGLMQDHDVKLVDLRAVDAEPDLKTTLESFQPDIIGCSGYTLEVESVKQVCKQAKEISPGILTVVGGHHATVMPESYFNEHIDVVVKGEGVFPFKKICEAREKKTSFAEIENIYIKNGAGNGQGVFTFKKEHPPLDELPFPARSLTSHINHRYQIILTDQTVQFASVRASMGCPFRCNFCGIPGALEGKVYKRSIEPILEELETLEQPFVMWVDDEFFLDSPRAISLAQEIHRAGIKKKHSMLARSDTIVNHPQCIEEWAKIGLEYIGVGFEAHSDKYLRQMGKTTTLATNKEVIRILHENNIKVTGNLIVQPDFTLKDFEDLTEYIKTLELDLGTISVWTPLPGTEAYEKEKDNFIAHGYNFFDFFHTLVPTKLPLKQFFKEFARCFVATSFPEKKRRELEQLPPEERMKFEGAMTQVVQLIENVYREYDESLW